MKETGIIGATGLVGQALVDHLTRNYPQVAVRTLVRRPSGNNGTGILETLADFDHLDNYLDWFRGLDALFICIGTTAAKTPSREDYRRIDLEIPLESARLAKQAGVPLVIVVSAAGADAESSIFYNRLKGEMETAVDAVGLPRVHFARPSLLLGNRREFRLGERFGQAVMRLFNFLIPVSYKAIRADQVARAMWVAANREKAPKVLKNALLLQWSKGD